MNSKNALEGIEVNLVMAANTKETQENNNNNYESCVDSNNIAKKVHY
jgi:hypothetical protein